VQVSTPKLAEHLQETETRSLEGNELPFNLQDVKAAIPPHCFESSVVRSLSYFFLDIGIIAGLYALAYTLDSWFFWPFFLGCSRYHVLGFICRRSRLRTSFFF
jgi:fatty acid desaturase